MCVWMCVCVRACVCACIFVPTCVFKNACLRFPWITPLHKWYHRSDRLSILHIDAPTNKHCLSHSHTHKHRQTETHTYLGTCKLNKPNEAASWSTCTPGWRWDTVQQIDKPRSTPPPGAKYWLKLRWYMLNNQNIKYSTGCRYLKNLDSQKGNFHLRLFWSVDWLAVGLGIE